MEEVEIANERKVKIGDKVWFFDRNKVICKPIIRFEGIGIVFRRVVDNKVQFYSLSRQDVFATKHQLIRNRIWITRYQIAPILIELKRLQKMLGKTNKNLHGVRKARSW